MTDQHDKVTALYENLDHHLKKDKKMHEDGEVDLVNAIKTIQQREAEFEAAKLALKEVSKAAQSIADMVEPRIEGAEPCPLSEILKDVPAKFSGYIQKMAKFVSKQLLSFVKSFYPSADLMPMEEGIAKDCSDELF